MVDGRRRGQLEDCMRPIDLLQICLNEPPGNDTAKHVCLSIVYEWLARQEAGEDDEGHR